MINVDSYRGKSRRSQSMGRTQQGRKMNLLSSKRTSSIIHLSSASSSSVLAVALASVLLLTIISPSMINDLILVTSVNAFSSTSFSSSSFSLFHNSATNNIRNVPALRVTSTCQQEHEQQQRKSHREGLPLMSNPELIPTIIDNDVTIRNDDDSTNDHSLSSSAGGGGGFADRSSGTGRLSYKRSVVFGNEGGRPQQVTALDMIPSKRVNEDECSSLLDKNNFELHVGRALDTLRKDYPLILTEDPDYSIYDNHIEVVDPSGVRVRGLKSYKNAFRLLHAIVKILYCPAKSHISARMCYDQARHNIRIHWNACVVPREIFGGSRVTNYVDGISVYEFDRFTGNITEHRIERLLLNDAPVLPKEGVIAALQQTHTQTVPSFIQQQSQQDYNNNIVHSFQQQNPFRNIFQFRASSNNILGGGRSGQSSLFALEATGNENTAAANFHGNGDVENDPMILKSQYPHLDVDWAAYQRKNQSRKKFGLNPLSPDEFVEIEAQVRQLALIQEQNLMQQKQARTASAAEQQQAKQQKKKGGLFQKLFGEVLQDTCESNFDCERPEICCDFGFQKRCCMSGSPVGRWDQLQPIRVASTINYPDDPRNY